MAKEKCIFAAEAPEVEIVSGMVIITHTTGRCVATTPANLQLFIAKASRALQDWQGRESVIPFRREYCGP